MTDSFATGIERKNSAAQNHLNAIPAELAYGLGALFIALSLVLILFWYRFRQRRVVYLNIYGGDLTASSINDVVNDQPQFMEHRTEKYLNKHPVPNFSVRHMHSICLYGALILLLFALTLFIGKPLGFM